MFSIAGGLEGAGETWVSSCSKGGKLYQAAVIIDEDPCGGPSALSSFSLVITYPSWLLL